MLESNSKAGAFQVIRLEGVLFEFENFFDCHSRNGWVWPAFHDGKTKNRVFGDRGFWFFLSNGFKKKAAAKCFRHHVFELLALLCGTDFYLSHEIIGEIQSRFHVGIFP